MRRLLLCAALCAALWLPALAWAGPGLLLGIDDDLGKWNGNSRVAGAIADLGATVQRITVIWLPGENDISGIEAQNVQNATTARRAPARCWPSLDAAPPTHHRLPRRARSSVRSSAACSSTTRRSTTS
jgi:hypothetical protein